MEREDSLLMCVHWAPSLDCTQASHLHHYASTPTPTTCAQCEAGRLEEAVSVLQMKGERVRELRGKVTAMVKALEGSAVLTANLHRERAASILAQYGVHSLSLEQVSSLVYHHIENAEEIDQ